MDGNLVLSQDARTTAGILLLAIVTVEYGGLFVLRTVRGTHPVTDLQRAFFRAGHAHAAALVILSLVVQLFVDGTDLSGTWARVARSAVPAAAILMPAGFFLSVSGRDTTRPNRLIWLLYLGAASLATGVIVLGVGLLGS